MKWFFNSFLSTDFFLIYLFIFFLQNSVSFTSRFLHLDFFSRISRIFFHTRIFQIFSRFFLKKLQVEKNGEFLKKISFLRLDGYKIILIESFWPFRIYKINALMTLFATSICYTTLISKELRATRATINYFLDKDFRCRWTLIGPEKNDSLKIYFSIFLKAKRFSLFFIGCRRFQSC